MSNAALRLVDRDAFPGTSRDAHGRPSASVEAIVARAADAARSISSARVSWTGDIEFLVDALQRATSQTQERTDETETLRRDLHEANLRVVDLEARLAESEADKARLLSFFDSFLNVVQRGADDLQTERGKAAGLGERVRAISGRPADEIARTRAVDTVAPPAPPVPVPSEAPLREVGRAPRQVQAVVPQRVVSDPRADEEPPSGRKPGAMVARLTQMVQPRSRPRGDSALLDDAERGLLKEAAAGFSTLAGQRSVR